MAQNQEVITEEMAQEQEVITLDEALAELEGRASARPFSFRVESACNAETHNVIQTYGAELGSTSEAIRQLIARGAASLKADRA